MVETLSARTIWMQYKPETADLRMNTSWKLKGEPADIVVAGSLFIIDYRLTLFKVCFKDKYSIVQLLPITMGYKTVLSQHIRTKQKNSRSSNE